MAIKEKIPPAPTNLPGAGMYRDWVDERDIAAKRLPPGLAFTETEVEIIQAWSKDVISFGLAAVIVDVPGTGSQVVEILFPDDVLPPSWIIYPIDQDDGFILEEFSGQRRRTDTVAEALTLVLK
jgi:hypothetical protein